MPKVAAMMASLVLIASSISINVARYPAIGQFAQSGEVLQGGPVQAMPAQATTSRAMQTAVVREPATRTVPQSSGDSSRKERTADAAQSNDAAEPISRGAVAQRLPKTATAAASSSNPNQPAAGIADLTPGMPQAATLAPAPVTIVAIRPLVSLDAGNPFASPQTNATLVSDTTAGARPESVVERLPPLDRVAPLDPAAIVEVNQSINYPATNTP